MADVSDLKVGLTYPAFADLFKQFFPSLTVLRQNENFSGYDLVIAPGGEDVSPSLYNEENRSSYCSPRRDSVEVDILRNVYGSTTAKILGICRGSQLVNVVLGGTLYQDIGMDARAFHSSQHTLAWLDDCGEFGNELRAAIPERVNSLHHQGINRFGYNMCCLAEHQGIPEVTVDGTSSRRIILLQYHPEMRPKEETRPLIDFIVRWVTSIPIKKAVLKKNDCIDTMLELQKIRLRRIQNA